MALPYKSPALKGRQFGPGPNPNVGKNRGTPVQGGPVPPTGSPARVRGFAQERVARKAAARNVVSRGR